MNGLLAVLSFERRYFCCDTSSGMGTVPFVGAISGPGYTNNYRNILSFWQQHWCSDLFLFFLYWCIATLMSNLQVVVACIYRHLISGFFLNDRTVSHWNVHTCRANLICTSLLDRRKREPWLEALVRRRCSPQCWLWRIPANLLWYIQEFPLVCVKRIILLYFALLIIASHQINRLHILV